jgi:hypothetical protein
MSDNSTSQSQQNPWRDAAEAHMARMHAFYEQLAKYETEGAERAREAVDEMARLTKEAIDHGVRLTNEWRRLSMEAAQRTAELAGRSVL